MNFLKVDDENKTMKILKDNDSVTLWKFWRTMTVLPEEHFEGGQWQYYKMNIVKEDNDTVTWWKFCEWD